MTMQKTFDVAGPVELEIKLNSGEIEVDATDSVERVEVELTAHDEASQELIDNGRVELQQHQQRPHLIIDLQQRRSGGFNLGSLFGRSGISCRVRVPDLASPHRRQHRFLWRRLLGAEQARLWPARLCSLGVLDRRRAPVRRSQPEPDPGPGGSDA